MKRALIALACLPLAGCFETFKSIVTVRVPVPIECLVAEPERPLMPTDALQLAAPLDAKVRALLAENELREGYEIQLVAALRTCKKPISPR